MTARKTTPAAPTLATLLADLDERREETPAAEVEIGSELREAKRAIDRAAHEREAELRAAVTENRKPKVAEIAERVAENEQVIADTVPRLRQVEAEIGKLDRERAALVDDRRSELVDEYIAECVQTRALLEVALAAIDAFRPSVERGREGRPARVPRRQASGRRSARAGACRQRPERRDASVSQRDRPRSALDAGHVRRWRRIAMELAGASEGDPPEARGRLVLAGGVHRRPRPRQRHEWPLHRHAQRPGGRSPSGSARQRRASDHGRRARLLPLRRERDLTREELDRHERHRLATGGGYVGPYDRNRGGIVLPDDLERDKHGGVVLDPDAPPEPSVSFIR